MIVVRAPLRISFVGGGTDLPDFYTKHGGRVLSTAIDKYVFLTINRTPLINKVSARYSKSETVDHPDQLEHTRIRAALKDLGILSGIEIASFASVPARTGLGSSSSFSTALLKGLHAFKGNKITKSELAEAASRLEIELLKEPIGKQDQYAAAFGGLNVITFNKDHSVTVEPLLIDFKKRLAFEDSLLVFYTGVTRDAASVLSEQKSNISKKEDVLKEMAGQVDEFKNYLLAGDVKGMGYVLHRGWQMKKTLASNVTNNIIDAIYDAGMNEGAYGGKLIGAGSGGCVAFLAPPQKHAAVRATVARVAQEKNLDGFLELPIKFVHTGTEILFNGDPHFGGITEV